MADSDPVTIDTIKKSFAAGTIPVGADFALLIDALAEGLDALGYNADTDQMTPGTGLELAGATPVLKLADNILDRTFTAANVAAIPQSERTQIYETLYVAYRTVIPSVTFTSAGNNVINCNIAAGEGAAANYTRKLFLRSPYGDVTPLATLGGTTSPIALGKASDMCLLDLADAIFYITADLQAPARSLRSPDMSIAPGIIAAASATIRIGPFDGTNISLGASLTRNGRRAAITLYQKDSLTTSTISVRIFDRSGPGQAWVEQDAPSEMSSPYGDYPPKAILAGTGGKILCMTDGRTVANLYEYDDVKKAWGAASPIKPDAADTGVFGGGMAMNDAGDLAAFSYFAPGGDDPDTGRPAPDRYQVRLFKKSGGSWTSAATLQGEAIPYDGPITHLTPDWVTIDPAGTTVAFKSADSQITSFAAQGDKWVLINGPNLGGGLQALGAALLADTLYVAVIDSFNSVSIEIFERDGLNWKSIDTISRDLIPFNDGGAPVVSDDGKRIAISSSDSQGSTAVFVKDSKGVWHLQRTIVMPVMDGVITAPNQVALSADGQKLVVPTALDGSDLIYSVY